MRMLKCMVLPLVVTLLLASSLFAQSDAAKKGLAAINERAVRGQLEFLASDWTEGRGTGEKGIDMAADYIESVFKIYGLEPGGDWTMTRVSREDRQKGKRPQRVRTYMQNFTLVNYKPGEKQTFNLTSSEGGAKKTYRFAYRTDFSVNTSDVALEVSAPLVFVGYGIQDKDNNYDEFKNLDVKGKIVVRLRGYPGHKDTLSAAYKKFKPTGGRYAAYYFERNKNRTLEKLGAVGVIEVSNYDGMPRSWAVNRTWRYNTKYYEGDEPMPSFYSNRMKRPGELSSSLTTVTVTKRAANAIVKGLKVDFDKFDEERQETMKPASAAIPGKSVYVKTNVETKIINAKNVIGVIEGKNTDETIVIGGHYDHMGKINGYIWNGADDNASGTVGVMTIAKAIMATGKKPEKTIVFAAWTGEEKGLLGSRYYVDNPYKPKEDIIINLNFDMIARDRDNDSLGVMCGMTYTKAYPSLEENTKKYNEDLGLGLEVSYRASDRPGGGSDHAPFAQKGIPVFYYMAAFHPDYHQIGDHVEKVNWGKMVKIIKLGFLNVWDIANMDGNFRKTGKK